MSDQKKPKFQPMPEAQTVTLGKMFSSGNGEYGEWYAYDLKKGEEEMTWFVNDRVHGILEGFKQGDTVIVFKEAKINEKGKPYTETVVKSAIFTDQGNEPLPAPTSPWEDAEKMGELEARTGTVLFNAYRTAGRAIAQFNRIEKLPPEFIQGKEEVEAAAMSIFIAWTKKWAL